jgi:hypothetical protein
MLAVHLALIAVRLISIVRYGLIVPMAGRVGRRSLSVVAFTMQMGL